MRRRLVAVVVVVVGLAACGAPGVGDRYYPIDGNGGYDVSHYDLAVRYDPGTDLLRGVATISARTTQPLATFDLDLVGMNVRSVTVDGWPAKWTRGQHELVVVPHRILVPGRGFTVAVQYDGKPGITASPTLGDGGFFTSDDGAFVIGQPEVAADWFPVNDHPIDKASYTFRVTVPNGYEVVANGLPVGSTTAAGWTTNVWEARSPMASYLATIDIGQWDFSLSATADGIPIIDATDPRVTAAARPSLAREPEMIAFLEQQFGKYPFETAGGIVDNQGAVFYALENQTRPVYSPVFFYVDQGDTTVVHELAHQWYGDSVALARWQDIWLNEGFATYAEWLWSEHEGFANAPEAMFREFYADIPATDPFWALRIGDPGKDHLFDEPVYTRGAMMLQALRDTVGDATFFTILRTWAAANAGGHGTTPRFIALADRLSGRRLDALFDAWLFSPGRPSATAAPAPSGAASAAGAPSSFAAPAAGTAPSPLPTPDGAARARAWRDGLERRLAHGHL
jgi:aminopeptidase N